MLGRIAHGQGGSTTTERSLSPCLARFRVGPVPCVTPRTTKTGRRTTQPTIATSYRGNPPALLPLQNVAGGSVDLNVVVDTVTLSGAGRDNERDALLPLLRREQ